MRWGFCLTVPLKQSLSRSATSTWLSSMVTSQTCLSCQQSTFLKHLLHLTHRNTLKSTCCSCPLIQRSQGFCVCPPESLCEGSPVLPLSKHTCRKVLTYQLELLFLERYSSKVGPWLTSRSWDTESVPSRSQTDMSGSLCLNWASDMLNTSFCFWDPEISYTQGRSCLRDQPPIIPLGTDYLMIFPGYHFPLVLSQFIARN